MLSAAPGDNRFFGAIAAPGQVDTHTLTTAATTRLWFDSQTNAPGLSWTVSGPQGVVGSSPFSSGSGTADRLLALPGQPTSGLLPAGTYAVNVSGQGDATGDYMFRILDLGTAPSITAGAVVRGSLPTPNGTSIYSLSAAAGDRFRFSNVSYVGSGAQWRLVDPFGNQLFKNQITSTADVVLPATGSYALILEGGIEATQDSSFSFTASLVSQANPPAITATAITPGTPVSGTVGAGGVTNYKFTLASPARLWFDSRSASGAATWSLAGPQGTVQYDQAFANDDTGLGLLPAGDYVLRVSGTSGEAFAFNLLDFAAATSLTLGSSTTATLNPANSAKLYKFSGMAGQVVYLDNTAFSTTDSSGNASGSTWSLFDAYGNQVGFSWWLGGDSGRLTLPSSGTYTLVLRGDVNATGTTTATFTARSVADTTAALVLGTPVSGTVGGVAQVKSYTFTLAAPTRLWFDSRTDSTGVSWSLTGPQGTVQYDQAFGNDDRNLGLLPAGDYVLRVSGTSGAAFAFNLLDFAAATSLTLGTSTTATLTPANSASLYRFSGTAGQVVYLDTTAFSTTDSSGYAGSSPCSLFDSYGNPVGSTWSLSGDSGRRILPTTGTYTLVLQGYVATTGTTTAAFTPRGVLDNDRQLWGGPGNDAFALQLLDAGGVDVFRNGYLMGTLSAATPLKIVGRGGVDSLAMTGSANADAFAIEPAKITANTQAFTLIGIASRAVDGAAGADRFDYSGANPDLVLSGGAAADIFAPADGATVSRIDGGADGGTLDYSAFSTGVVLDAAGGNVTGVATVANITAVVGSPRSDAPIGVAKTVTTLEDTAYTFATADFGFTDPGEIPANALAAVKITTLPTTGTLTNNGVAVTAGSFVTAASITGGKLVYTPVANANGLAPFTFQVQDTGGTANGGLDLDPTPRTLTGSITPVNDPPAGAAKTVTTLEDTAYTFATADFGFTDPADTPANALAAVKITTLPATGTLTNNGVAVTAGSVVTAASITGGKLVYTPAANANGLVTFTFQVQDDGGTANGGLDLDPTPRTMTVSITPVNDPPAGAAKTVTTLEDTAYTFATADFGFTDPGDTPANALAAVRITTLPATGTLTNNGAAVTAGSVVTAASITGGKLVYTPAANATGSPTFTFQVQDDGGTANGGLDLDPTPRTLTVSITPVNDPPAGAAKTVTTLEDTAYTFATADFGFTDQADTPANALAAVKITTLPATGTLTNDGVAVTAGSFVPAAAIASGKLVYAPASRATGLVPFTFQVQDDGGSANGGLDLDPTPRTLTVSVMPVNHAPTDITLLPAIIAENNAVGAIVGMLTTTDPDAADTFTYTLVAGTGSTDNASFTIAGGALKANTSFDYETKNSYSIRIRSTDQGGLFTEKAFTITVADVFEPPPSRPVFSGLLTTVGVTRVSADAAGGQGNKVSYNPVFSPDGSKVAFYSYASNLVPGDTNDASDIFVKDLVTGAITRVSTDAAGGQGDGSSSTPVFSPDGSKVAFYSWASNLVPGDTNGFYDIFVKDLVTGAITRVSTDAAGGQGNGSSTNPVFSPNGSKLAFNSNASNLVPGDTNDASDIFVKDLVSGAITRVSTDASGGQGNAPDFSPVFSPDGSKMAFESIASNLVPGDTNGVYDIFVKDLSTGAITRVSTNAAGGQGDNHSSIPVFSPDGSKIAFWSSATNLVPGDTNGVSDIFVAALGFVLSTPEGTTTVATLGATDRDPGTTLAYSISGTDAARFTINAATGALAFASPPSFLAPADAGADNVYEINVSVTDGVFTTTVPARITVTQVPNRSPTDIALSASSIAENNAVGATIGTLTTTDPDAANTFTYTLVSGTGSTDNASFTIAGGAVKANASFDYETKSSYSIRIRSTDQGGLFTEKAFTITVTNVNEAPTDIALSASSIAENNTVGATIGTLTTTDPDAANTFTYTLVSGTGSTDNASFTIAGGALKANASFDYETKNSYSICIRSTDQGGLFTEKAFTILVTDVFEAPPSRPVFSGLLTTVGVTRVSTDAAGGQGNNVSYNPVFSPDGSKVAFYSWASNLVPGDTGSQDIFVKDLATGAIMRVSTDAMGGQANDDSFAPVFSPDGSKLAFLSRATNLVPGDRNGCDDIFVKDLATGAITRVSTSTVGGEGNGHCDYPSFSPDGTKVMFTSAASNLVSGDTNGRFDIFVKDLLTGVTTRISTNSAGGEGDSESYFSSWNSDGSKIVFQSAASNLVPGDTNGSLDIFVKDLVSGVVTRVSTDAAGNQGSANSHNPFFSPDGSKVVFHSFAPNLVSDDTNGYADVFIKDLVAGAITRVSTSSAGTQANAGSYEAVFSPDGSRVAFISFASNLVPGDSNDAYDIFVKDLVSGAIARVNTDSAGVQGEGQSYAYGPAFSPDGSKIAFWSSATNLVRGDTNGCSDIFVASLGFVLSTPEGTTAVATLGATDRDPGTTLAYSISGTDAARFTINSATGALAFASPPSFLAPADAGADNVYDIKVSVTDGVFTTTVPARITVTQVANRAPTDITLSASTIAENNAVGATNGTLTTTDPDAANTFTYTLVSGTGSTDNASFTIAGGALKANASFDYETKNSYSIRIRSTDQGGLFTEKAFTITVTNVNESPTDIALSASSIAENNAVGATIGTLTTTDPDAVNTFTYTLVSGTGSTDNASFSIAGGALKANASFNYETKNSYSIRIRSTDQGGLFMEKVFTILVTDIFEAPPSRPVFSGLLTTVGITRVSTNATGAQANYGAYNDEGSFTPVFSPDGTKVAFTSRASNLVPGDTNGFSDIFVKDLVTGAVSLVSTDAAGVQANGASIDPVFSPDGSKVAFASRASNLSAGDRNGDWDIFVKDLVTGSITRVSAGVGGEYAIRPIFSPDGSRIAFPGFAVQPLGPSGTNFYQVFVRNLVTGVLAQVSTDDAGRSGNGESKNPVFSPDGSKVAFYSYATNLVPGDTNNAGDIFVKDLVTGAITRVSTDAAGGQGNGFSDYPVFSADGSKVAFGSYASNLVPGDTNRVRDIFVKDLVTGAIARVSTNAVGGQGNDDCRSPVFSSDGSKILFDSIANNLVPGDTNNARDIFLKDLVTGAITRISSGVVTGNYVFSSSVPAFSPDGSKVAFYSETTNLVPADTNGYADVFVASLGFMVSTPEGTTAVATLGATDRDPGTTLAYSISGTDAARFTINSATGGLTFASPPSFRAPADADANNVYDIKVSVTDGVFTTTVPARITVTQVANRAPTDITLSASTIAENNAVGATIGTLTATDPDAANTFTYALVAGTGSTDNASFTIQGNQLRAAAIFNFETKNSYSVRIRSTDQGGLFTEKVFAITVTNVNEAPTNITLSASSIAENNAVGATIGTLTATDPDAANTFTYALVAGTGSTDNASFTIQGNQLRAAAIFNFETKNSYSIRVRGTDQGGLFTEKVFAITVTNVNEAPTNITLSASSIAENNAVGATIGTLATTDPDAANTFTYALVAGTGSTDNALFTIAGNALKANASFNFETKNSYSVRVRSTDQGGLFTEKVFSITVTNVNEAPTGTPKTVNTLKNTPYAFLVADFGFTDPLDTPANALAAVKITTSPTAGTLRNNGVAVTAGSLVAAADIAAGRLVYTPAANAMTAATFTFQVQDNGGTANGGINLDPTPRRMTISITNAV